MAPKHRLYTPEIAEDILERLKEGESLASICARKGMPTPGAVRYWVTTDHDGFAARYARAREVAVAAMADEILAIADDNSQDAVMGADGAMRPDHAAVQRAKLKVDARKWMLAKLLPRTYGDRVDLTGEVGVRAMPDDQLEARLLVLLGKAGLTLPGQEALAIEPPAEDA